MSLMSHPPLRSVNYFDAVGEYLALLLVAAITRRTTDEDDSL